jgi:hypothetical protein
MAIGDLARGILRRTSPALKKCFLPLGIIIGFILGWKINEDKHNLVTYTLQ